MPSAARARRTDTKICEWSATRSRTRWRAAASCSSAVRPSGERSTLPASTCWRRPATRTWKNSSRLPAKMARNLTRSSSGFRSSRASWRTRALNSSHDSSRLRYGKVAFARVARRWRGATVGRAGAPGSIAAMGDGVLYRRIGTGRDGHAPRPARIARAHGHSSATYRRSPDAGSSQTRIRWPDVGSDEDLVAAAEARVEACPRRFAAGRLRRAGRPDRSPPSGSGRARRGPRR